MEARKAGLLVEYPSAVMAARMQFGASVLGVLNTVWPTADGAEARSGGLTETTDVHRCFRVRILLPELDHGFQRIGIGQRDQPEQLRATTA